ncbi:hypothetical protein DDN60_12670 [Vibrio cholerae]|nr:hypothetical protein [Vibrio cholerae]
MENIVLGIIADERLKNIICEREDCFVNTDGELCISDPQNDYSDVIDLLKNSELAFGGSFFGIEPSLKIVDRNEINDIILHIKSESSDTNNEKISNDNSESKLRLKRMLEAVLQRKCSDIHLRLNYDKKLTQISSRKDGEFIELMGDQELTFGEAVCYYAAVTLGKRQAFNSETQVDCTFFMDTNVTEVDSSGSSRNYSKNTKWRMSQIKIDEGTKVTIRALETGTSKLPELGSLGLTNGQVDAFVKAVNAAQGAVIMSGPTGSGKTTTINCALQTVKPTRLIHSLEDPVEFSRQGRNHFSTPVSEEFEDSKTKLRSRSFEYYGKVLLRHDTDGIYFGEVRDKAAAAQFMRLATTGQVMVGTLHCNSGLSIITTMAEQFHVPVTQLAAPGILKALAHQRLVRTLCPSCKIPHSEAHKFINLDPTLSEAIASNEKIASQERKPTTNIYYRKSWGDCKNCSGTGEKNRTALFELILIDDKAREFIRELKLNEWLVHLKTQNWPSIVDHAKAKVLNGLVDYRSVIEQVDDLVVDDLGTLYKSMHMEVNS